RRRTRGGVEARGDLLLRSGGRPAVAWHGVPPSLRPGHRPPRRGAPGRRGPRAARLARTIDGSPRIRPVLPERDGRAVPRACLADQRPSRSRLGPRHLAGAGGGSATPERRSLVRLTVAQAIVRFLVAQWTERDGVEQRLFAGCLGIFGH